MTSSRRLLQSAPLFLPAVCLIVGIIIGDCVGTVEVWWSVLLVLGALCLLMGRWSMLQSLTVLLCVVALGGQRSSTARQQHDRVTWHEGFVTYEAVVVSEAAEKPKTVAVDIIIVGDGRRVKCYVAKDEASRRLTIGDRLKVCSRIERNSEWRRGAFDYRRYLEVHGFSGHTYVRQGDWQQLPTSWEGLSATERLKLQFLSYRHLLLERYRQMGADDAQYAVLAAMTLGDKSAMTQELRDIYAVSGASHVLALSGLHLGIIYMLLSLLIVGRRLRYVVLPIVVIAIWAFVLLVGMPSSVVRAAVMISLYALLSLIHRGHFSLNALSLAAIIILVASPDSLWDVGFQLSFAAMLAILTIQPCLGRLIPEAYLIDRPVLRWLWGIVTVSLAAQIGTAPLVAYYFGRLPVYFLITNIVVIPAATVIIWLVPVALLLPLAGGLLLRCVGWLNDLLTLITHRLPHPSIEGLHPSTLQTALVYVLIVSLFLIVTIYDKHL